jgi:DNA-nicking Smr family endonuclease
MSPTDRRVGARGLRPREPVAGGSEPFEGSDGDDDRVDDDDRAFAEAVRGVRPLGQRDARLTASQPAVAPHRDRAPAPTPGAFIVEQTGDEIAGRAADVSTKLLRELRAGAHAVDARLDVHGRGRAAALRALESFVAGARARGARTLLVIHGRGLGSDAAGPCCGPRSGSGSRAPRPRTSASWRSHPRGA